jgi:hypothetical protein
VDIIAPLRFASSKTVVDEWIIWFMVLVLDWKTVSKSTNSNIRDICDSNKMEYIGNKERLTEWDDTWQRTLDKMKDNWESEVNYILWTSDSKTTFSNILNAQNRQWMLWSTAGPIPTPYAHALSRPPSSPPSFVSHHSQTFIGPLRPEHVTFQGRDSANAQHRDNDRTCHPLWGLPLLWSPLTQQTYQQWL